MKTINLQTNSYNEMIDISFQIENLLKENNWEDGIIYINIPHTTAAITINENADPDVQSDMINGLEKIIPNINFKHFEGNSDAHIKSSLFGCTLNIMVENYKMLLGTWQGIYFCEFDGPRNRKVNLKFIKS